MEPIVILLAQYLNITGLLKDNPTGIDWLKPVVRIESALIYSVGFWGRIFILDFAYISRNFPSDPRLFSSENEEISTPPPWGLSIGIYLFHENWSTETFRNFQKRNISDFGVGQRQFGIILSFIGY